LAGGAEYVLIEVLKPKLSCPMDLSQIQGAPPTTVRLFLLLLVLVVHGPVHGRPGPSPGSSSRSL
jgi:hypothetical protein